MMTDTDHPALTATEDVMTKGYEEMRFQVPSEVADDLRAKGFVRYASNTITKGVDVGELVLVVYNSTASTITLFQAPDVIRALATSLANWFRSRGSAQQKFELTARGPHGFVEFRTDEPPDAAALALFLRENIWGDTGVSGPVDE
jgi:hypothetical protein